MTPPRARKQTDPIIKSTLGMSPVAWRCSCGEAFGGRDMEKTVHIHGAYTPGVHHITGPFFRDGAVEAEILAEWEAESKEATRG
jgi:hypothetical protein